VFSSRAPTGARLLNTGCWIDDAAFRGSAAHRPGFALRLAPSARPTLVNLLDR
jgi:hypothetical protein